MSSTKPVTSLPALDWPDETHRLLASADDDFGHQAIEELCWTKGCSSASHAPLAGVQVLGNLAGRQIDLLKLGEGSTSHETGEDASSACI